MPHSSFPGAIIQAKHPEEALGHMDYVSLICSGQRFPVSPVTPDGDSPVALGAGQHQAQSTNWLPTACRTPNVPVPMVALHPKMLLRALPPSLIGRSFHSNPANT